MRPNAERGHAVIEALAVELHAQLAPLYPGITLGQLRAVVASALTNIVVSDEESYRQLLSLVRADVEAARVQDP